MGGFIPEEREREALKVKVGNEEIHENESEPGMGVPVRDGGSRGSGVEEESDAHAVAEDQPIFLFLTLSPLLYFSQSFSFYFIFG